MHPGGLQTVGSHLYVSVLTMSAVGGGGLCGLGRRSVGLGRRRQAYTHACPPPQSGGPLAALAIDPPAEATAAMAKRSARTKRMVPPSTTPVVG